MRRHRRGFSLIELLVVIFILAVGLTSVSALFVAGILSSRKAEHTSAALNAARRQMERLRSGGFPSLRVNSTLFPTTRGYTIVTQNVDETGAVSFQVPELPSGQGSIAIAYYVGPTGTYYNLKDVTVTVNWHSGPQATGEMRLRTFIANHP